MPLLTGAKTVSFCEGSGLSKVIKEPSLRRTASWAGRNSGEPATSWVNFGKPFRREMFKNGGKKVGERDWDTK